VTQVAGSSPPVLPPDSTQPANVCGGAPRPEVNLRVAARGSQPASGVWSPSELLWSPDTATKATDFDPIARIVDVSDGLSDLSWRRR
jgi:hypothetical protein